MCQIPTEKLVGTSRFLDSAHAAGFMKAELIPTMNLPSVRFSRNGDYNADQSRFLRVIQSVFLMRRKLEIADLYEEPFTNFGSNAVEKLFGESQISELIALTKRLAA